MESATMNAAWLITWQWWRETQRFEAIAAILSIRRGDDSVVSLMKALHQMVTASALYTAHYANRRTMEVRRYRPGSWMVYGHNPELHARQVKPLLVVADYETGEETISWSELPEYAIDATTHRLKQVRGPVERSIRRPMRPLATHVAEMCGYVPREDFAPEWFPV